MKFTEREVKSIGQIMGSLDDVLDTSLSFEISVFKTPSEGRAEVLGFITYDGGDYVFVPATP